MEGRHAGAEHSFLTADKNLPVDHFSLVRSQMPLYTYLFTLRC